MSTHRENDKVCTLYLMPPYVMVLFALVAGKSYPSNPPGTSDMVVTAHSNTVGRHGNNFLS